MIGGSAVRVEGQPDKKEGMGRRYYVVVIGPGGEVPARFIGRSRPTWVKAFTAENETIGVVVIYWEWSNSKHWYVWDGHEGRLEENLSDFWSSRYYDRLKAAHPDLPDR